MRSAALTTGGFATPLPLYGGARAPLVLVYPNSENTSMSISYLKNSAEMDDWLVSFDKVPQPADKPNVLRRIAKSWDGVKSDLDGLAGIKLTKPDLDAVADALVKSGKHAVIFDLVLTEAEFKLNVEAGDVIFKAGSVRVPSDLEEYRNFLASLNGWSTSARNIVPDADFKSFNDKNPKTPQKPTEYKDFDEMVKKSKSDLEAFRDWAKTNSGAKKAFADIDKTAKAKPTDPARVAALKAINASLKDYYKSF
jgi:hypothetical protein